MVFGSEDHNLPLCLVSGLIGEIVLPPPLGDGDFDDFLSHTDGLLYGLMFVLGLELCRTNARRDYALLGLVRVSVMPVRVVFLREPALVPEPSAVMAVPVP